MRKRSFMVLVATVVAVIGAFAGGAALGATPFVDIAGNTHAANIDAIYNAGLTGGCDGTHYCPDNNVTRGQMASFLARTAAVGKGNFPKANARSATQTYCSLASTNPGSYPTGACTASTAKPFTMTHPGGFHSSIAIGTDGLPIISFAENPQGGFGPGIVVGRCTSVGCSEPTHETTYQGGNLTERTSIAVGTDGMPVISSVDYEFNKVNVLHCLTASCDGAIDGGSISSPASVTRDKTSIAIGADGLPVVAFNDNGKLAVGHCAVRNCSTSTVAVLDAVGGGQPSLAIGSDGFPVVSYLDNLSGENGDRLSVAHCTKVDCASGTQVSLVEAGGVGQDSSIAIGADGTPIISYFDFTNFELHFAKCTNVACSASVITDYPGPSDSGWGQYTAIAIGTNGLPVASFYNNSTSDLMLASCTKADCSTMTAATLDSAGNVGRFTSIAIGLDGRPVVAYFDVTNNALKVARPANA